MHETVDRLLSLKIQCTFWPLLINLRYNVKSWTTKKTTRCLPRSAACNHNLKLTRNKSQQWNQSMVELGGNKSENSNVSQNLKGTLHQFQQKVKQRNPCELQPSNTLGRSKRGAPPLRPENEVGHPAYKGFDRFSFTYWQHQNKLRPWHAVTRGEYKLWTNAGGTILFTAARRYPSGNCRARSPLPQDVAWRDRWSQLDEGDDAPKTKWPIDHNA